MKKICRILFVGLALGFVALFLGFLTGSPAPAQAPVPVRVTNTPLPVQGSVSVSNTVPVSGTINAILTNPALQPQVASDTVTLQTGSEVSVACQQGTSGPINWAFDRSVVKSGGTIVPFVLPAGKVLVVTSLDWTATGRPANGGPSPVANLARTAFLFRVVNGGLNGPSAQSTAAADSTGKAGGSETFPTGAVLQNPGQFCLGMDTLVPGEALVGVLQGFLAPDR
jgi:hypothetical protein